MAGYLTRLAGRALGTAPLAEPAVPARFAPTANGKAGWGGEHTQETTAEISRVPSQRERREERVASLSAPDPVGPQLVEPQGPEGAKREELGAPQRLSQVEPTRERSSKTIGADASHATRARTAPMDANPSAQTSRFDRADGERLVFTESSFLQSQDALAPATPASGKAPRPPLVREALPMVREQRSPALNSAPGQVSAPPSVRVTIGRIDIRADIAAPSALPVPAARPRSSALSLDQFLKGRSEGRR